MGHSHPVEIDPQIVNRQHFNEFIETAAHDLQSPLRKLSVLTERLTDKYKSEGAEDVRQYVNRIQSCIQDMQLLIDGLAELAVISNHLEYTTVNSQDLINKIIEDFESLVSTRKAVFEVGALPDLYADYNQCRQLFHEIIKNTLVFCKVSADLRVKINSYPVTDKEISDFSLVAGKQYDKIVISDNGIGIDPANTKKVFHPFVKLNGKSAFPGNGLGLAKCEKIVQNHKGVIYANGSEYEGASFVIIIPVKP